MVLDVNSTVKKYIRDYIGNLPKYGVVVAGEGRYNGVTLQGFARTMCRVES